MAAESEHRGKGHAAFTESDVIDYIRERGGRPATTGELAEEFDVSDVAIRKRIKEKFDQIGSRKVRNRRIWYLELDSRTAEPDGYGSVVGWGFPVTGLYPWAMRAAFAFDILAVLLLAVWAFTNQALFVGMAVGAVAISIPALVVALRYKEQADPTFAADDVQRSLDGRVR